MACGMPVIATAIGETERIIEEAGCGVCVGIGEAKGLADAILDMKASDRLSQYGDNARKYYLERFAKDKFFEKFTEVLNESAK